MSTALRRITQRYLVPGFLTSLYYYVRTGALVSSKAIVQPTRRIHLGPGTVVKAFATVQVGSGSVSFGTRCAISNFNHIHAGDGIIDAGNYVRIGPNVVILGSEINFEDRSRPIVEQGYTARRTVLGDDVLVGAGAIILAGAEIETGAVIGAGSLVLGKVSSYSIVAGRPAKPIGARKS